jgi:hypothetical protein
MDADAPAPLQEGQAQAVERDQPLAGFAHAGEDRLQLEGGGDGLRDCGKRLRQRVVGVTRRLARHPGQF